MKLARIIDRKLLDSFHLKSCIVCGKRGCDPCHIMSVGAGGDDVLDNLMPLCRLHHTEQHQIGLYSFVMKYRGLTQYLKVKGWDFTGGRLFRRHGF